MRKLLLALFLSALLVSGCNMTVPKSNTQIFKDEETGMTAQVQYQGNNNWTYAVKGSIPTPCHDLEVNAIVAESYPEQVFLKAKIVSPAADVVCDLVIKQAEVSGSFQASEQASIQLSVEK